jgi:hypothetical protein
MKLFCQIVCFMFDIDTKFVRNPIFPQIPQVSALARILSID